MSSRFDIIVDPYFKSGFFLQGPSPVTDQRVNFHYLGYGGNSILPSRKVWIMSQWWTPFDFKDAIFHEENGVYEYSNESRRCLIDIKEGSFHFELDSGKEYMKKYGHGRTSPSDPWSHFLLEQDFHHPLKFRKTLALMARLNFSIEKVVNEDESHYDPKIHAAQFLWYVVVKECAEGEAEENSLSGRYIWIGIPIYDNRYAMSKTFDQGFQGATNALIYTLSSGEYLPKDGLRIGEKQSYEICYDLFPHIKKSVRYAVRNGIFKSEKNVYITYMNIGWELPGSFQVASTIKSLRLEAISDE